MSVFTADNAARLLDLLGKEQEIFGQIRETTEKQTELIEADDIEGFDKSLDSRQELIEKINGLHQETELLMQSYMSYSTSHAGGKIEKIDKAIEQLQNTIAECAKMNEKNTAAAKQRAEDYAERSGKLNIGRKSLGSYMQTVESNSEMFDKKM